MEEKDSTHFTNLLSIYAVTRNLKTIHKKDKKVKNLDEANIESLLNIVTSFFDWSIDNCEEYNQYFVLKSLTLEQARAENKHLLFRPIGINLLSKLYAYFVFNNKLEVLESRLSQLSLVMPHSVFNKILWNNGKMEATSKNFTLAFELSKYLLGTPFNDAEVDALQLKYRTIIKNDTALLPVKFT